MRVSTIYCLCDPSNLDVRYVGKTVVPLNIRISQHYSRAMKGAHTHLHCWIRSLSERPIIKQIEVVPYENDAEAEIRIIAEYRAKGFNLVNQTDGGEGKKGCYHSEETKEKIRKYNIGRKMPPKSKETLQRMADAQRGKKHSEEHRAKIALAGIGRKPTPETLEKLRIASKGRGFSEKAKMLAIKAKLGKPLSEEHKAKIRDGMNKPEVREKLILRWSKLKTA